MLCSAQVAYSCASHARDNSQEVTGCPRQEYRIAFAIGLARRRSARAMGITRRLWVHGLTGRKGIGTIPTTEKHALVVRHKSQTPTAVRTAPVNLLRIPIHARQVKANDTVQFAQRATRQARDCSYAARRISLLSMRGGLAGRVAVRATSSASRFRLVSNILASKMVYFSLVRGDPVQIWGLR